MSFFKSVNIWQHYKQERDCIVHFVLKDGAIKCPPIVFFGGGVGALGPKRKLLCNWVTIRRCARSFNYIRQVAPTSIPSDTWYLGPTYESAPIRHIDRFCRFCTACPTNRPRNNAMCSKIANRGLQYYHHSSHTHLCMTCSTSKFYSSQANTSRHRYEK